MPGYDAQFTSPLDKAFECPVCLIALRDPMQITPCGHRVCNTCLQPILRNKRPRCPLDNLNFDHGKVFSDNGCHRQILNLQVLCSNLKKGCEWIGPLSDVELHESGCSYAEVSCPKRCGASLERRQVTDHSLECVNRLTTCSHCGKKVVLNQLSLHLQNCASFPVSCPANCGETGLTKEKLTFHMNIECPLLVIPCKFLEAGCTFKTERFRMKDHLSGSTEFHLNSLYDLVCTQKKQLENQRERIQLQKEHIQLQKESLLLQNQEIADVRSRTANGKLIWRITDFTRKLMDAKSGRAPEPMISEPFFTHPNGYKMCAGLWLNGIGTGRGRYMSVGLQVQVGEFDSIQKWPMYPKYTFTLLDQRDQFTDRRDISVIFEPQIITRPSADRQLGKGARRFVLQEDIRDSSYCKDDVVFLKFEVALKQAPSGFFKV
ncbi:TNF receptor-associated factor 4-like isoform X1 [Acropora muricata]|uniref:TNF receptor-associated factor 4-like n=2 Tax=Acropora TaxID=6127 RepID=UPI0010FC8858|nr:TNF receptor-associated factor 4-like [Acropora millepora]